MGNLETRPLYIHSDRPTMETYNYNVDFWEFIRPNTYNTARTRLADLCIDYYKPRNISVREYLLMGMISRTFNYVYNKKRNMFNDASYVWL